jgi:L-2-hydroxyglutarate oxidase
VARLCGVTPGVQVVPFRGEYYELVPERAHLVRGLIYPVPDARFPFLGVHFTRAVDDTVEAGPNAVLALRREGYTWGKISPRDLAQMMCYRGFWRMAWKYGRMGLSEMYRSLNRAAFLREMQKLIPDIQDSDIRRGGSGVRAQALGPDGKLVDDFHIVPAERMIHVLNAPSPAATASLSIGQSIADLAKQHLHWRTSTSALAT